MPVLEQVKELLARVVSGEGEGWDDTMAEWDFVILEVMAWLAGCVGSVPVSNIQWQQSPFVRCLHIPQ